MHCFTVCTATISTPDMLVAFVRDVFVAVAILIALIALAYPPPEGERARELALDVRIGMSPSTPSGSVIAIPGPVGPTATLAPR